MNFTQQPKDFAPINEGLVYGFETEYGEPEYVEVAIVDADTDEVVGWQSLYDIEQATVDVAAYARRFDDVAPCVATGSTLCEAAVAHYRIEVDDVASQTVTVSHNRVEPNMSEWLSAMPEQRNIAFGERDEVRLFGAAGAHYTVDIIPVGGLTTHLSYTSESGAAVFMLDADDLGEAVRNVEVHISCNGKAMRSICYTVVPRYADEVRLAWVSAAGTIERYTFPAVRDITHRATRQGIAAERGVTQVTGFAQSRCMRLVSGYERLNVIEALAEIAISPRVWIDHGNSLDRVEVLTMVSTLYEYGRPCYVEVDICYAREEGRL